MKVLFYITDNNKIKIILTIIVFIVVTILFSSLKGMTDGLDRLGFPLVFFQHNGGKCQNCSHLNWFKFSYLIFDLFCCFVLSSFMVEIYKIIYKRN